MEPCACTFCAWRGGLTLPMPVLLVHPRRLFSAWVWVTSRQPLRIFVNGYDQPMASFEQAMRHIALYVVCKDLREVDVKALRRLVHGANGGLEALDLARLVGPNSPAVPLHPDASCECRRVVGETTTTFTVVSPLPAASQSRRKRLPGDPPVSRQRKVCARASAPMPVQMDTSPSCATAPPPTNSSSEDERNDVGGRHLVYDLLAQCGNNPHVASILDARPIWDAEVIEELIRWGAKPLLKRVHETFPGTFTKARCTFVQPDGTLVPNIWLPLGYLKSAYRSHVDHLR